MRNHHLIMLLLVGLAGCGQPEPDIKKGCVADIECKEDRLCEQGVCVEPTEPSTNENDNNAPQTNGRSATNGSTNGSTDGSSDGSTDGSSDGSTNSQTTGPMSCIDRDLDELAFAVTTVGTTREMTVTISNCGTHAEDFHASILNDAFTVTSGAQGTLPPGEAQEITVQFAPEEPDQYRTALEVALESRTIGTRITGEAIETSTGSGCPEAVAEAKLSHSSRWQTGVYTIPLKTIDFRATNSVDADGTIERYEWNLVQRPTNSTARFQPNANVAEPSLFLDLTGDYVVELTVFDDEGTESCGDPALITIRATPDEDIHVQLVWDTPTDQDQTDTNGTDVDLHFLHPHGTWNNLPFDIFWDNPTNSWGAPGADDDPSLDIDDTDGAGPENVNLTDPESGLTYAVGAYYYAANDFGPSYATVRIYIRGQQQFESLEMLLPSRGSFWDVATISWPSTNISDVNEVQEGFPNR